jgi:hypothetical protein
MGVPKKNETYKPFLQRYSFQNSVIMEQKAIQPLSKKKLRAKFDL